MELRELIETGGPAPQVVTAKQGEIYRRTLAASPYLDAGNFTVFHPSDIELLFDLYDGGFFHAGCRRLLGEAPLTFRLSKRMTRAGGTTRCRKRRDPRTGRIEEDYEISIATTLLFQSFQEPGQEIVMSGITCKDRLEALQRVVEHEMTHLLEMLIWGDSSCSAPRFHSIANRFFGHTEHRHQLVTPKQQAFEKFGVRAGDRVTFRFEGRHYEGRVNRITKRATVLVEDAQGERYSDGKRYAKFYIPVNQLRTITE